MNRRKSIGLLGLGSIFLSQNVYSFSQEIDMDFIDLFLVRWDSNRIYTFEILEAMPESKFAFEPIEGMMSFNKLFTHIGVGIDIYAEKLDGVAPKDEPETIEKVVVSNYLKSCFEHFESAYKSLNNDQLYTKKHHFQSVEPWMNFSVFDIIILAYNHTIHHRAQATTYLRLNEITPPKYQFWYFAR